VSFAVAVTAGPAPAGLLAVTTLSVAGRPGRGPSAAPRPAAAVLAAGVGVQRSWGWSLRAASFRLEAPPSGQPALGILIESRAAATAVVDLLAGLIAPSYGELRVLGEDMRTERGRAVARGRIGIARRGGPVLGSTVRIRGLIEHAARRTRLPRHDRNLLTADIIDRLSLQLWEDVPLRAAPDPVARRARLAAAAVHQPELLLIDGLLDDLDPLDAAELAEGVRNIGLDTGIVAAGQDPDSLTLTCGDVLALEDGILVGPELTRASA
jgi:ABC-type multidrug transport system ATPase subunit